MAFQTNRMLKPMSPQWPVQKHLGVPTLTRSTASLPPRMEQKSTPLPHLSIQKSKGAKHRKGPTSSCIPIVILMTARRWTGPITCKRGIMASTSKATTRLISPKPRSIVTRTTQFSSPTPPSPPFLATKTKTAVTSRCRN